jgi:hypothetical protein
MVVESKLVVEICVKQSMIQRFAGSHWRGCKIGHA